ncbi:MAG TPA: AtpZ/AtpI family protein [Gammaproteobacteria bacterium]|nr:AtpZ/AtpI family protein [Gammaproteobacteria bacterium]
MKKPGGSSLLLLGVGTMLTSMVISGALLGYGLDAWLNTRPLFMLILGCLGFVGGMIKVYKMLSRPDASG